MKRKSKWNARTDFRELDCGKLGSKEAEIKYRIENWNPYSGHNYEILLDQILVQFGDIQVNVMDDMHDEDLDEIIHGLKNHEADESDRLYDQWREQQAELRDEERGME